MDTKIGPILGRKRNPGFEVFYRNIGYLGIFVPDNFLLGDFKILTMQKTMLKHTISDN